MSWNYRVVKRTDIILNKPTAWYAIHEAHYYKNSAPHSISENSIMPHGDTPDELKRDIELMLNAFDKPVLNYEDF